MLTESRIRKIDQIDQIVKDYFESNPAIEEVAAKDLMSLFVSKGVFARDYSRPGLPIRNILRELDELNKLHLLRHCKVVRNKINRNWYFNRHEN
jgi:hypothetical protein